MSAVLSQGVRGSLFRPPQETEGGAPLGRCPQTSSEVPSRQANFWVFHMVDFCLDLQ